MPIRNGRFKSARKIIDGRLNEFYRILNSGEFDASAPTTNAIRITFGNGVHDFVDLLPTFSVDIKVGNPGHVSVAAVTAGQQVEGIYEALPNAEIRSGRFKTKGTMVSTAGVTIITAGGGSFEAIYRIFNSGSTPLQLKELTVGGTEDSLGPAIAEDESYDFKTTANKIVLVKPAGSATGQIEGIYDFIAKES